MLRKRVAAVTALHSMAARHFPVLRWIGKGLPSWFYAFFYFILCGLYWFYWYYVVYIMRYTLSILPVYMHIHVCIGISSNCEYLQILRYHDEILTLLQKGRILSILVIPRVCYFAWLVVVFYQNCDCIFHHMLYFIMLSQKWLNKDDQSIIR